MAEENKQLDQEAERTLAGMYETEYFHALDKLIGEELETVKTHMLNVNLTGDQLRFYQGRAEGLGIVLLRIKKIHDEFKNTE